MIETTGEDRRFPPALADVAKVEFDYDDGEGVDFEPYGALDPAEETTDWPRHWTVFQGSEGERGVVAGNLSGFLWVLADGVGPLEVVEFQQYEGHPGPALTELAARHATTPRRAAREIVTEAQAEFPAFSDGIDALCR
ncbi:SMI1/KNR4 family protein [Streptomyces sp. NPDC050534]|uniref:SMI1/KNR4 family protein n=1 Tax=Streptomyces sp. NPDC050534 TaxID=3365625 RepID=UPI0037ADC345